MPWDSRREGGDTHSNRASSAARCQSDLFDSRRSPSLSGCPETERSFCARALRAFQWGGRRGSALLLLRLPLRLPLNAHAPRSRGPAEAMGAAEADRTLFVGNLDPRVTEELVFELFHQAGPVIKVKIPKDRDGKPKQFAFVNFKHEESVPYGMSLLHGIKLFGRPLKIQFRSGSSHASQEVTSPCAPHGFANGNPSSPQLLAAAHSNRFERNTENMSAGQRSLSSLDNHQLKAMMTSAWQQVPSYGGRHNSPLPESLPGGQQGYSFPWSSASPAHWRSEPPRKGRASSHPYQSGHRHHGQEQRRLADCGSNYSFRGSREDHYHDDRNYGGWS